MSIKTYVSGKNEAEVRATVASWQGRFAKVDSITVIAVNHNGCGASTGWADTSMKELRPECVAAGCTLGFHVETCKGMVHSTGERNGYHDSDFFANIFDRATGKMDSVEYATTRGWTYFNTAEVDLSDEDRAECERIQEAAREAGRKERARREAEAAAKLPTKGKRVRVKSTRSKIPHGTEGEVFYFARSSYARPNRYGNPYSSMLYTASESQLNELREFRVGIRTADGKGHFCAATAVEVVQD